MRAFSVGDKIMKPFKTVISLVLILSFLLLPSCDFFKPEDKTFIVESGGGQMGDRYFHEITVSAESDSFDIRNSRTIKFKVGIGSNLSELERSRLAGKPIYIIVEGEGCEIMNLPDKYTKEYPDYYDNDKYIANVEDVFFGYDAITPNYFEDIYITFPEGECKGWIKVYMYRDFDLPLTSQPWLEFCYGKNDSVLLLSKNGWR